jgi:hypothetical protein
VAASDPAAQLVELASPNRSAFSISIRVAFGTSTPTSITVVLMSALVSPRRNRSMMDCFSGAGIRPCNSSQRNGRSLSCHCSNSAAAAFAFSFSLSSMSG